MMRFSSNDNNGPSPLSAFARQASRREERRRKRRVDATYNQSLFKRSLRLEQLEVRQLLAADLIVDATEKDVLLEQQGNTINVWDRRAINDSNDDVLLANTSLTDIAGHKLQITSHTLLVGSQLSTDGSSLHLLASHIEIANEEIRTADFNDAGFSEGDSGDILFSANVITIGTGTVTTPRSMIDTQATNGSGFKSGQITLTAIDKPSLLERLAGSARSPLVSISRSPEINIVNAELLGGEVIVTSTGETITRWDDVAGYSEDIASALVDKLKDVDEIRLQDVSPLTGQTRVHTASASISLTNTFINSHHDVRINAEAITDASLHAIALNGLNSEGFPVLISIGLGNANSTATIDLLGSSRIDALGSVSLSSDARTKAKVNARADANSQASASTVQAAFNVALAITNETSKITVAQTALIDAASNVSIEARGNVENDVTATTSIFQDGSGGLSVAVGVDHANITSEVLGTINSGATAADRNLAFNSADVDPATDEITLVFPSTTKPISVGERLTYQASNPNLGLVQGREYIVSTSSGPRALVGGLIQQSIRLVGTETIDLDTSGVPTSSQHLLYRAAMIDFMETAVTTETASADGLINLSGLPENVERLMYLGPDVDANASALPIEGLQQNQFYDVVRPDPLNPEQIKLSLPGTAELINFTRPAASRHAFYYTQVVQTFVPATAVDNESDTIELLPGHGLQTGDLVFYQTDPAQSIERELVNSRDGATAPTLIGNVTLPDAPIAGLVDEMGYRVVIDPLRPHAIRLTTSPLAALAASVVNLQVPPGRATKHVLVRETSQFGGVVIHASLDASNRAEAGTALSDEQQPWPEVVAGNTEVDVDTIVGGGAGFIDALRTGLTKNSIEPAKSSSKTDLDTSAGSDDSAPTELSSSVAVSFFTHIVQATVGPTAVITSQGDVSVEADVQQKTKISSVSEAARRGTGDSSQPPSSTRSAKDHPANQPDNEISLAVGVGVFSNDVKAEIASGAMTDALGTTAVAANVEYPLLMASVANALNPYVALRDAGISGVSNMLDGSLGLSQLFNAHTRSVAGNINDRLTLAAGVVVSHYTNSVVARIGDNAKVNVGVNTSPFEPSVIVSSNLEADLLEAGQMAAMNLDFQGFAETWLSTTTSKPFEFLTQLGSPFGAKGERAAGGVFLVTIANNTTVAEIGKGAEVIAGGGLQVLANSDFYNLSIVQTGARSTDFGFSAAVSAANISSHTTASISTSAKITASSLDVFADDQLNRITVAGAFLLGKQVGIGTSIGVNVIDQDVAAFVGRRPEDVAADGTIPPEVSLDVTSSMRVAATSGGDLFSLVMAGAAHGIGSSSATPVNGTGGATVNSNAKQTGPIALTIPVAHNFFSGDVDAYVDSQHVDVRNLFIDATANNNLEAIAIGASFALQVGAANAGKLNLAGVGAVAINVAQQNVAAFVKDSQVDPFAWPGVSIQARDNSTVKADAGGFGIAVASSPANRASLSFGVSVALNDISGTTEAFVDRSTVVVPFGNILLDAASTSTSTALSIAGGLSARVGAGSGGSFGGAGAASRNDVNKSVTSQIKDSQVQASQTTAGNGQVSVRANDSSAFLADAGGFGIGVAGGSGSKIAGAIGSGFAFNDVSNSVLAEVLGETTAVEAFNAVTVSATSNAKIDALSLAGAVTLTIGTAANPALSGVLSDSQNFIGNTVRAAITSATVRSLEQGIDVLATDSSKIEALTIGASVAVAGSGSGTGSLAIGLSFANNEIGNDVAALLDQATLTVKSNRIVAVKATDNAIIDAMAVAASLGLSGAAGSSLALSGGGAETSNVISSDVTATIRNQSVVNANQVQIEVLSDSKVEANVFGAYASGGGSLGSSGSASIGAGVANNTVRSNSAADSGLVATLQNSHVVGSTIIKANATGAITSNLTVGSVAISAAGGNALSGGGAGARATNDIARNIHAILDGGGATNLFTETTSIRATDASTIDSNVEAGAIATAASAGSGGTLSVGVSLANNKVANDVQAAIRNATMIGNTQRVAAVLADETADIHAKAIAIGISAGVSGGLSVAIGGGGASSINEIDNKTRATIEDSNLQGYNTQLYASSNTNIDAVVESHHASIAAGNTVLAASIGVALAENRIGSLSNGQANGSSLVEASVRNSTIDSGARFIVDALAFDTVNANVFAGAVAAAVGANGGSAAGTGTSASNLLASRVAATVENTTVQNIVGAGNRFLRAVNRSTSNASVGAASTAFAAGQYSGAISMAVSKADTHVANTVTARIVDSTFDNVRGMSVAADENSTAVSKATTASVAAALGIGFAISGGGAIASSEITSTVVARQDSSDFTSPTDALVVAAFNTGKATAETFGVTVAAGLLGVGATGSIATSRVVPNTSASVTNSHIDATGLSIVATARPEADAKAGSFTMSTGLAVGVSSATVELEGSVTASLDASGKNIDVDQLTIHGFLDQRHESLANAQGSTGGFLLGVDATRTKSMNTIDVSATIADNTWAASAAPGNIDVSGRIAVRAERSTRETANASSVAGGLIAVGVTSANAVDDGSTTARIGSGIALVGGELDVSAPAHSRNFAFNTAGSGGGIAAAVALPRTENRSVTSVEIGNNAHFTLTGAARFSSSHLAEFNTRLTAASGGLLTGGGGRATSVVVADVITRFGQGSSVTASSIDAEAINRVDRPNLGAGGNVNATTGGLFSGVGVFSSNLLSLTTDVSVEAGASLTSTEGDLDLHALNHIDAYDRLVVRSGGVAAGGDVTALIRTLVDQATVTVAGNLQSVAQIGISARGTGTIDVQSNSETYGAATVGSGTSTVDIRPVNSVLIRGTATLRADHDLNISSGTDTQFNRDAYRLSSLNDTFAGSLIPLNNVNAYGYLIQTNLIQVDAGGLVQSGGNMRLHAERQGFNPVETQAKATTWVTELANGVNDLTGAGGVEAYGGGVADVSSDGRVVVNGKVETGIHRHQSLVINSTLRDPAIPLPTIENPTDIPEYYRVEVDASSSGRISFQKQLLPTRSSLDIAIEEAQEQRQKYRHDAGLRAFYDAQIGRMQEKQLAQGIAYRPLNANGTPANTILRVQQNALSLVVDPIFAQAGSIDIRADGLDRSANGEFAAPSDAKVEIINKSPASLILNGITIPETNGGLFLNGADVSDDHGVARQGDALIHVNNKLNLLLQPTDLTATPPTYNIADFPWPNIDVRAAVSNLNGRIELTTYQGGGGSIEINAPVAGKEQDIKAGRSGTVTIDLGTDFSVGGSEPQRFQQAINSNGTVRAELNDSNPNVTRYLNEAPVIGLEGERIFVTAGFINVNDIIQSGRDVYRLVLGQDVATEIEANEMVRDAAGNFVPRTGLYQLTSVGNQDLGAAFDYDQNRIVVEELRVSGGYVDLTGSIANTKNGEIRVLSDYAKIEIDNRTRYDMQVNRLDNSQRGEGTVIIKDTLKGTEQNPETTIYQKAGDRIELQSSLNNFVPSYITGTNSLVYEPLDNLRLGWTVIQGTVTTTTTTYGSASLWGLIDFLARDPDDVTSKVGPTTRSIAFDRSGPRYFEASGNPPRYFYERFVRSSVTDSNRYDLKSRWSGWGPWSVETVRWKWVDETTQQILHKHDLAADRPIDIRFLGQSEGAINIRSDGNIYVNGELRNPSGTTSVVTSCRIEGTEDCNGREVSVFQESADGLVGGRLIDISTISHFGTSEMPIRTNVSDSAHFDYNSSSTAQVVYPTQRVRVTADHTAGGQPRAVYQRVDESLNYTLNLVAEDFSNTARWQRIDLEANFNALTRMGNIAVEETSGDLPVKHVWANTSELQANPGRVTLTAAGSIVVGATPGWVNGNSFDLTSKTGSIGTADQPLRIENFNVSQSALDSLTAWAVNDIYTIHSRDVIVDTIEAGGVLRMQFDPTSEHGTIIDANYIEALDQRAIEDLRQSVWNALQLTDGAARKQELRDAIIVAQARSYHDYWNLRETQIDPTVYDPDHVVPAADDERNYLREQGIAMGLVEPELSAYVEAQATTLSNSRTQQYHALHGKFGVPSGARDPSYQYTLTEEEVVEVDGMKVWTEEELQSLRSRSFLSVTDTEFQVETPNITAQNVEIVDARGVGRYQNGMTIPLMTNGQPTILTLEQHAALDSAEPFDVIHFTQAPLSVRARVENGTIRFIDERGFVDNSQNWASYGFSRGQEIFLELSRDTTDEGVYYEIISVSGATMTIGFPNPRRGEPPRPADLQNELLSNILIAPVADTPQQATHLRVLRREDIDLAVTGTVDVTSNRQIFIGAETDLQIGTIHTDDNQRVQIKVKGDLTASTTASSPHVIGGRLVFEANTGSVGSLTAPLTIQSTASAYLIARAADEVVIRHQSATAIPTTLKINQVFSQTSFVNIASDGNITQAIRDGITDIRASDIVLRSTNGSIGSVIGSLDVDTGLEGSLTAIALDDIRLTETSGDMYVRLVRSQSGQVDLIAAGSILDAVDVVDPFAETIVDVDPSVAGNPSADVIGTFVNLTAIAGTIGQAGNELDIDSNTTRDPLNPGMLAASSHLNAYIHETRDDLILSFVGTNAETAFVSATDGSILPGQTSANISSGKLWLFALDDIGSSSQYLRAATGSIEGIATTGDVFIHSSLPATIGGVTAVGSSDPSGGSGSPPPASSRFGSGLKASGKIDILSEEPLEIMEDVIATEQITIQSKNILTVAAEATIQTPTEIGLGTYFANIPFVARIFGSLSAATTAVRGSNLDDQLVVAPASLVGTLRIEGREGADNIIGSEFSDLIFGGGGDDWIHGGAGIDTIDGGEGCDRIIGGLGLDAIIHPAICDIYGTLSVTESMVVRDIPVGTPVGTLAMNDLDAADALTFRLVEDSDGRFALVGNQIVVADAAKLSRSVGQTTIVVEADHLQGGTTRQAFELTMVGGLPIVQIASSTWSDSFIATVGDGLGGLGVVMDEVTPLRTLPWISGVDSIYVQFSEDVSAAFTPVNLALAGINQANYLPGATLNYGVDGPNVGTIRLSTPVTNDRLLLTLFDTLSLSGAGGQYNLPFNVLAGDADGSGAVNFSGDLFDVFGRNGGLPTRLRDAYFDLNADGAVNLSGDLFSVVDHNGDVLPFAAPPIPSRPAGGNRAISAGPAAASDAVFGDFNLWDDVNWPQEPLDLLSEHN